MSWDVTTNMKKWMSELDLSVINVSAESFLLYPHEPLM